VSSDLDRFLLFSTTINEIRLRSLHHCSGTLDSYVPPFLFNTSHWSFVPPKDLFVTLQFHIICHVGMGCRSLEWHGSHNILLLCEVCKVIK